MSPVPLSVSSVQIAITGFRHAELPLDAREKLRMRAHQAPGAANARRDDAGGAYSSKLLAWNMPLLAAVEGEHLGHLVRPAKAWSMMPRETPLPCASRAICKEC